MLRKILSAACLALHWVGAPSFQSMLSKPKSSVIWALNPWAWPSLARQDYTSMRRGSCASTLHVRLRLRFPPDSINRHADCRPPRAASHRNAYSTVAVIVASTSAQTNGAYCNSAHPLDLRSVLIPPNFMVSFTVRRQYAIDLQSKVDRRRPR